MERERARLFDLEAERYDRVRPTYPDGLIDEVLGDDPERLSVLDVGCGTGIAARQMRTRGATVLGVELNERMAEVARRHGVPTEVARFEAWDAAGRTFDRVTCAQAWHWLDPVEGARRAAAVLRPGGRLCIFWSIGHHPDELTDALRRVYEPVGPLMAGYAANHALDAGPDVAAVVASLTACERLVDARTRWFPWSRAYTRDGWLDELRTHSDHIALPPDVREGLLRDVGAVIDGFGGSFEMPYASVLISVTRRM